MDTRTRRQVEARRAGLVERLVAQGLERQRVEQLMDAWDDVAYELGLGRLSPDYWTGAFDWVGSEAHGRPIDPLTHREPTRHDGG
jgi:hypothetical protein